MASSGTRRSSSWRRQTAISATRATAAASTSQTASPLFERVISRSTSSPAAAAETACGESAATERRSPVATVATTRELYADPPLASADADCGDPELPEREGDHPQQQPAVPPATDVRLAVGARLVAHRQVEDLHVEARRAQQQVEIAERVELAEVGAPRRDAFVVGAAQHLRAA